MKLTRVFAGVAAVAVAACSMAITSFAAITNANTEEGTYMYDAMAELPSGVALSDVYGAQFTFTGFNEESGTGGGFVFNSDAGWDQVEWGNEGSNKAITFTADNLTVKRLESEPVFADGAQWAQVVIAQWDGWGDDITIESVSFLDKDGNVIGAAAEDTPADDTPAEDDTATTTTTAAADDTATTTTTTAASNSAATGVEGVASVVALLTIAGAAIVVTKKN